MSVIGQVEKWLEKIAGSLMVVSFVGVIVMGTIQVFSRYVLSRPLVGAEELAQLFGVWMVFLGSSIAAREGSHIKVKVFHEKLPPRARQAVDWIVRLVILAFSVLVSVYGLRLTARRRGILKSPALRFPMHILFAAVAVGSVLTCLFLLRKVVSGAAVFCKGESALSQGGKR